MKTHVGVDIHPTAVVDVKAELADGVKVGPYTIIEGPVVIGEGTQIGAHCFLTGHTFIGKHNRIFTGAVIGSAPQDVKYRGEKTYLRIGDRNIIREYVTINPGTGEESETFIGDDNWLMTQVHVAHNCRIGSKVKLANVVTLAGHVEIQDGATIGGLTPIHQYVRIGRFTMIGGGFRVPQDVPPFTLAGEEPLRLFGLNRIGLERNGFSKEKIQTLKKAYRIAFRGPLPFREAAEELKKTFPNEPEVTELAEFLLTSQRGITRAAMKSSE